MIPFMKERGRGRLQLAPCFNPHKDILERYRKLIKGIPCGERVRWETGRDLSTLHITQIS